MNGMKQEMIGRRLIQVVLQNNKLKKGEKYYEKETLSQ